MSNVLVGIIGVILFIGLALAGALFLGPRFQQSKLQGQAATVMMQVDQISKAYDLYRTMEGRTTSTVSTLVSSGYLKAQPDSIFRESGGTASPQPDLGVQQYYGDNYVQVSYNMPSSQQDLCQVIRDNANQTNASPDYTDALKRRGTLMCNSFSGRNIAYIVLEKL